MGFGRRRIDIAPDDLSADVLYQLGALDGFARAAGDRVRYLKPHGALYHAAATDPGQAGAVVSALLAWDRPLPVLTLPGSALASAAAAAGLPVVLEAFCDRGYRADGSLVPREPARSGAARRRRDRRPGAGDGRPTARCRRSTAAGWPSGRPRCACTATPPAPPR